MSQQTRVRMRISFPALLGWTLPIAALVAVAGLYPTWRLAGREGLLAEGMALGIVLTVMLANGLWTVKVAARGPTTAAFAFMVSGMVRVVACVALAALAWWALDLELLTLGVWVVIFYLAVLAGEGIWLTAALRKDAFLVALGEIRRPGL